MGEIATNLDPAASFRALFRRTYCPIDDVSGPFPWTAGAGIIRHCFTAQEAHCEAVYKVLCAYVTKRLAGVRIGGLPQDIADICSTYWNHMTEDTRQKLFRIFMETHLLAISKRGICLRPEFMFLVGYGLSFAWAYPYARMLSEARHGLSELGELCEKISTQEFVAAFIGKKAFFLHGDVWPAGIPLLWHLDDVDYLNPNETFEGESCRGSLYPWFRMVHVTDQVSERLREEAMTLVRLGGKPSSS